MLLNTPVANSTQSFSSTLSKKNSSKKAKRPKNLRPLQWLLLSQSKKSPPRSLLRKVQKSTDASRSCLSPSALTLTGSTTPRTCALHATANSVEKSTRPNVSIPIGSITPSVCVRLATSLIIIREEPRSRGEKRRRPSSLPNSN